MKKIIQIGRYLALINTILLFYSGLSIGLTGCGLCFIITFGMWILSFISFISIMGFLYLNSNFHTLKRTWRAIQFGLYSLITIGFFGLICMIFEPFILNTTYDAYYRIINEPKLQKFEHGEAPIENGVWVYTPKRDIYGDISYSVPCENGQIHGIASIYDPALPIQKYYHRGILDSITYRDEKIQDSIRVKYYVTVNPNGDTISIQRLE